MPTPPEPRTYGGWRTATSPQPPQPLLNGLLFKGPQSTLAITAVTDDIIRVRFSPVPEFGRDHSYTILEKPAATATPATRIESQDGESLLATAKLQVRIHHTPFGLTFLDADGRVLDEDEMSQGTAWAGARVQVSKRLDDATSIYGLGEKTGRLNKRGWCLGGYSYAMWATDTFSYDLSTDPMYVSVPFYLGLREGRAFGIFLDNTHRSFFDIGRQQRQVLTFGAEGGELNYYFIAGPHPRDVVARYTQLTGRCPLPPRWATGYHQCRWSYYPESRVRKLADDFRAKKIPADVLWLDVHYLDGYAPFTWDAERFPDPKKLLGDLRAQGFRVVPIVDPHIKIEAGHAPFDTGNAGGHFVKNPDGSLYEAPVWPSNAEKGARQSAFPDFTRPETRTWWGTLFKDLTDLGVGGIWNDMNEPAVFVSPTKTLPTDIVHDNEGQPAPHPAVHNVYGLLNSRATHEGLLKLRPNERPFVLTRSSFAGGQRYAAVWTGDNTADWSHLQQSIPMLLGLGLSGFPLVGADIGGFSQTPSPELFTRWLQAGVFYPFMRVHAEINKPDQEPWSFGEKHEAINRRAIELRYEFLPYLYSVMAESFTAGLPAMRPLVLEYPTDAESADVDDVFLFGRDLLVAPVIRPSQTHRGTYLPPGEWFDYWTSQSVPGGKRHYFEVTLTSLPLYVRAGGFLFHQPVVQHTGEMPGQPFIVTAYPGAESSEASFYEDDGETLAHKNGHFARRTVTQQRTTTSVRLILSATKGDYRPAPRDLVLRLILRPDQSPRTITIDGTETPHLFANHTVEVRLPDRREGLTVEVRL
ncbi:MAG: glycoside hydrolase family 31 protein [Nibricoccus sp.]